MKLAPSTRFCSMIVSFLMYLLVPCGKAAVIGWWTFDDPSQGVALDESGNDNHIPLNGASFTEPDEGVSGRALEFDEIGDLPQAGSTTGLRVTTSFTIELWIKPTAATSQPGVHRFVTFGTETYVFRIDAQVLHGYLSEEGLPVGSGFHHLRGATQVDTPDFPTDEWSHVAFTYDGTEMKLYLNGELDASTACSCAIDQAGSSRLLLSNGTEEFFGLMDDLHIFDEALEQNELGFYTGGVYAHAGADQTVLTEDAVTLDGTGSRNADSFAWEQVILGSEPELTLQETGTPGIVTFTAPTLTVGTVLTFRLTATKEEDSDTDEIRVIVRAKNRPMVPPSNLQTLRSHKGFVLSWGALIDADAYAVEIEVGPGAWFVLATVFDSIYTFSGLEVGTEYNVRLKAKNSYGDSDPSETISYVPMENIALPAATVPPSDYVYVVSHYADTGMNNEVIEDDNNDSWDGSYKAEDYWGYLWPQPVYIDAVTYFTGNMFGDGGWFLDLKVQYTKDGTTWINVPTAIRPDYDFTDQQAGKKAYTRYEMDIPTVYGMGVRVYGTPGGTATFTSISELEMFADTKTSRPLVVQGIDGEVGERGTGTIDASFSFSTRGDVTSMIYEQITGPSVTITVTGDPLIATFEAPGVDADTELVFTITGSDGTDTRTDEVTITVKNVVTTAVAGPDQSVGEGATASLDGSGSLTTTGTLTYQWTQTFGDPVTLNNANAATAEFEAPVVWNYAEELVFQLEVNDGAGGVSTDEVTVHVVNSALLLGLGKPLGTSWVQDVLVLGENYESRILSTATNQDQLAVAGGQANQNPQPGDTVDLSGTGYDSSETPLVWTPMHRDDGWWFDNRSGRGCVQDNFIGYFHLYVFSTTEQQARVHYGNDDDMRGWNNGELILSAGCCTSDSGTNVFTLSAGVNSMTFKVTEYGGDNYMRVRFTDRNDRPLTGLYYSLSVPIPPSQAYAVRDLPASYDAGATVDVTLSMRVNPDDKPSNVTISEPIPAGLTVVDDGGGTLIVSSLSWSFSGTSVATQVLNYTLGVPGGVSGSLNFPGTIAFSGTTDTIKGDDVIYETPAAPETVYVEMLLAANLSWSVSPQEGVVGYRVYRSENGQPWEEIGFVSGTSFTDGSIAEGNTYNYQVAAVNAAGVEGDPSAPTGEKMIIMEVREAEDYNYGGGEWPGYTNCPAGLEAPDAATVGTPQEYDFFYAADIPAGDARLDYRPNDNCGTELREATVNIGWITVGDWWRYTFNVPAPGPDDPPEGWVRIVIKVAYTGTVDLYWDEVLVDSLSFATGDWGIFTYVSNEEYFQTTPGLHTLRVVLASGGMNFDTIGMGFKWSAPTRETLFEDDFEDYTTLYSFADLVAAGYTVNNGSGVADGAWRLWNTAGDFLNNESPALDAMTNNYAITDSDLAGAVDADEELITPSIDCTGHRLLRLYFNMNYRVYVDDVDHDQVAEVDVRSSDDGVTWGNWVNLQRWDSSTVTDMASGAEEVDLSAHADGKFIQVRWHYYEANYDYWFAVDDIRVSGDKVEVPPPKREIILLGYAEGVADLTWETFGGGNYTVQYTADLTSGSWDPIPDVTWPITATTWSGDITGIFGQGVYLRVRSE